MAVGTKTVAAWMSEFVVTATPIATARGRAAQAVCDTIGVMLRELSNPPPRSRAVSLIQERTPPAGFSDGPNVLGRVTPLWRTVLPPMRSTTTTCVSCLLRIRVVRSFLPSSPLASLPEPPDGTSWMGTSSDSKLSAVSAWS